MRKLRDGGSGLKVFELKRGEESQDVEIDLELKSSDSEIDCYDVIAHDNTLIVSNREDIRQFDYSSLPMEELGRIK